MLLENIAFLVETVFEHLLNWIGNVHIKKWLLKWLKKFFLPVTGINELFVVDLEKYIYNNQFLKKLAHQLKSNFWNWFQYLLRNNTIYRVYTSNSTFYISNSTFYNSNSTSENYNFFNYYFSFNFLLIKFNLYKTFLNSLCAKIYEEYFLNIFF